jgi:hypothetical protein
MTLGILRYKVLKVFLFLSIFIVQVLLAQGSGTVKGVVFDKLTNDGLPGDNIIEKGTGLRAAADLEGAFTNRNVPVCKHTLIESFNRIISTKNR